MESNRRRSRPPLAHPQESNRSGEKTGYRSGSMTLVDSEISASEALLAEGLFFFPWPPLVVVFTPAEPGSLHPSSHTYYYYQILQIMAGERSGWFRNSGGVDPRFVRRDSRVPFGLLLSVRHLSAQEKEDNKRNKTGQRAGVEWSGIHIYTAAHLRIA